MKIRILKVILIVCILVIHRSVIAYDDQVTHRKITEKAIAIANIEGYIIRNLGLDNGLLTAFPSASQNTIKYSLMEGSKLEDAPPVAPRITFIILSNHGTERTFRVRSFSLHFAHS
jgi:hypothetical protein